MRIAADIIGKISPQRVAENFIKELIDHSYVTNALCLESVAQFAESVFIIIGFECEIKSSQIKENAYEWPLALRVYTFPYNPSIFNPLGTFLKHMSAVIMELQQTIHPSQEQNLKQSPIGCFVEFLDTWQNICNDLKQEELTFVSRHFEEPLARINFCLLLGLHPLRKVYRNDYRQLDEMCNILYHSALQGLFYPQCHIEMVEGLSNLFSQDYQLFYEYAPDTLDFFLETFSVENRIPTRIKIFKLLEEMLQNPKWTQSQLLILTNYLIEEKMQEVYFTIFKLTKTKGLLIAALQFLKTLQSKLPSMDCFSKLFIESFWALILHCDDNISSLAAEVYITIMQRKFDDPAIMKHILEVYFSTLDTINLLSRYINSLWNIFPSLLDTDEYIEIIKSIRTPNSFRAFVAHFLVHVCEGMIQDFGKYQFTLENLLLSLPIVLKDIDCQLILGILLRIYPVSNFITIKHWCSHYMEIFLAFEDFAFDTFTDASHEYPLMWNLFGILNYCLQFTKNWYKLEKCGIIIYNLLRNIEHELDMENVPDLTVRQYNVCLQKLSILLKTGYDLCDNLIDLKERIKIRLIDMSQMIKFATATNCFHDVYAIEILTSCFNIQVASNDLSSRQKSSISTCAQQLEEYLLTFLSKIEDLTKMPLVRINTIFGCFIDLHCIFHNESIIHNMKLSSQTYSILVEILIFINFNTKISLTNNSSEEKLHSHPERIFEYQKMLLQKFIKLHSSQNITIPSNVTWKLCFYYKLYNHKFNSFLEELLHVIAINHFNKYRHIMPVLIYNLYNRQPPLKNASIKQVLMSHKHFIDNRQILEDPQVLKVHIILTVLQIIEKFIKLLPPNSTVNRLMALEHLNILVEDIEWTDKNVIDMIIIQANELAMNILNPVERKTFKIFIEYFEKFRNS